jgi:hypothetical protein
MKTKDLILAASFVPGLTGCAAQIGAAGSYTSADTPDRVALSTTLTSRASRKSAPVVGVRSTQTIDHGILLKQVALHGGYDGWLAGGRLILEPGIDLGAGGPLSDRYDGIGAYAGAAGSARLRLAFLGDDDLKRSYSIVFVGVELVLAPRYGVWFPPEESSKRHVVPEFGFEGGLRFVFGSDIVGSAQGRPAGEDRPGEASAGDEKQ